MAPPPVFAPVHTHCLPLDSPLLLCVHMGACMGHSALHRAVAQSSRVAVAVAVARLTAAATATATATAPFSLIDR